MSPWLIRYLLSWAASPLAPARVDRTVTAGPADAGGRLLGVNPWVRCEGTAHGRRAADKLMQRAAAEAAEFGLPRSSTAPPQNLIDLVIIRETPVLQRLAADERSELGGIRATVRLVSPGGKELPGKLEHHVVPLRQSRRNLGSDQRLDQRVSCHGLNRLAWRRGASTLTF